MNKPNREMFQYAITKVFISQGRDVTLHYMTPTISIAMLLGNVKAAYDIHVYVQIHTQFWDSNHALPRSRLNFDLKTQKRMEMDKMYAAYCLTLYCASNLLSVFCEVQTMRIWDDQPQKVRPTTTMRSGDWTIDTQFMKCWLLQALRLRCSLTCLNHGDIES